MEETGYATDLASDDPSSYQNTFIVSWISPNCHNDGNGNCRLDIYQYRDYWAIACFLCRRTYLLSADGIFQLLADYPLSREQLAVYCGF